MLSLRQGSIFSASDIILMTFSTLWPRCPVGPAQCELVAAAVVVASSDLQRVLGLARFDGCGASSDGEKRARTGRPRGAGAGRAATRALPLCMEQYRQKPMLFNREVLGLAPVFYLLTYLLAHKIQKKTWITARPAGVGGRSLVAGRSETAALPKHGRRCLVRGARANSRGQHRI